tara:strand:- start:32 stop:151 length:120 start_codon:yes stop_codon:yes gene_type:complete
VFEQVAGVAPTTTVHLVERAEDDSVQTANLDCFQPACSA